MREKIFVLTVLFAVVFVSCGGGGGSTSDYTTTPGADFVTISIDSGAPYTYTETANSSSPVSYDPYIWSSSTTTSAHLYIHTYNGSPSSTPRMEIGIKGVAPGTYNISDGNVLYYMPAGSPFYSCTTFIPGTSGTITVTEFGPLGGGQIKGSFDAIATVGTSTTTAHLTGSFSITRN